jgi:uncharacterized protein YqeY
MSLKARINEDMKSALRGKDAPRLGAIRLLLAAVKQREVDDRIELSDDQIVSIIDKLIKQRRDSIAAFEKGGRDDLVQREQFEIDCFMVYMPKALSDAEVEAAVADAIRETGAAAIADMGKVMAVLKPRLAGKADLGKVSGLVRRRLGG